MAGNTIEMFQKGAWVEVPALSIHDKSVIVTGRWIKTAVIHAEEWQETELEDPEECIRRLKAPESRELRADIFTFSQKLPVRRPRYPYPMEWDNVAAVRVTSFADWWEKVPQETRKNTRRSAKRGVVVRPRELDDDLIRGILEINNESPVKQGRPFAHYRKTYDEVKRDYQSFIERSDLICAYLGAELIGLMKIVYCGEAAAIMRLLSKASHYDKRPANALIAKAVERCEEKAMSHLIYGKYRYGNQGNTSLMEFKARHGFEEIVVPRYYVPLTVKGRISLRLKLHRDLVGILPRSALRLGVTIRARWYALRLSSSRCSSTVEQPKA